MTRCGPRTSAIALSSASFVAPARAQRVAGLRAVAGEREQQVLGGDVLVLELAHLVLGGAQDLDELAATGRRPRRRRSSVGSASSAALSVARAAARRSTPSLREDGRDDAAVLLEQDGEQVLGRRPAGCGARCGERDRRPAMASWDLIVKRSACIVNLSVAQT